MGERGDQGFEVVPTRIGGGGGPGGPGRSSRRRRLTLLLVVLLAVGIPTLAWAGPHIEWRPDLSFLVPTPTPLPTPTPRRTPAPTPPRATPMPPVTVGVGPHPTEPFAIDVDGMRFVDPTTGSLGEPLGLRVDSDAIFTSRDGSGWWCVCFARVQGVDRETATVEVRRVSSSGDLTMRQTVGSYVSVALSPATDFYTRFDLVVSPDQRTAYLTSGTRSDDTWSIALDAIDLFTGKVAVHTDLGKVAIPAITGPTPPPDMGQIESYLNGPLIRLSPDGRRAVIWAGIDVYSPMGLQDPGIPQGWLIDLEPGAVSGSVGHVAAAERPLLDRLRKCGWATWVTPDEIAAICWPAEASNAIVLVVLDADGTELAHIDVLSASNGWLAEPVLDRANRRVYLWQPADHILSRVDLDTHSIDRLTVDPAATSGGLSGPEGGADAASLAPPEWATFNSDLRIYITPQLLPDPASGRLFALGIVQQDRDTQISFGSTGIWVFDAESLSLLDRWEPLAGYGMLGLSGDAKWLYAAAGSGADQRGNSADWQASITVYDVSDGRPALQLGRLGTDVQVLLVPR